MPHVCLVAMTGFRVADPALRELGLTLPGLQARGQAIAALPALGLLTLASHTPDNWTQSFHEAPAASEALGDELAARKPVLVAISALTASIEEAWALCAMLRARAIPTVMGGLHVTALPDESLAHCDAVVIGDGETAWPLVLHDAAGAGLKQRYRAAQFAMADARVPRWDLLPPGKRRRYTLQTARGCPLACEFCAASRVLGPFREKPARCVRAELNALRGLDRAATLELADDNTFAGERDASELLQTLADSGMPWFTECDWRIGTRPELCREMAAAGCVNVLLGIESVATRYRGMGPKAAPLEAMFEAVRVIQDAGICVNACFVAGADGETPESLEKLADTIEACPAADVQLTLQTPFPGSALYARMQREGRLRKDRTWKHHTLFDLTFQPDQMTAAELEARFPQLLARIYSATESQRRAQLRRTIWRHGRSFELSE